ncbi:MAG TPA: heavy metal translocating P-type ATPase metal-binding domain-containing protein, partial [Polyangiaceae bacterium]|nr:heavy metal translocating P-type ATPase metal-binding domain-containing protein [Polyangiaceae bacterium]
MLFSLLSALIPRAPRVEPEAGACAHCGLLLPAVPVEHDDGRRFCCSGCSTVYAAIQGAGLSEFYEERELASPGAR